MEKHELVAWGMGALGALAGLWAGLNPMVQAMLVLMTADVISGFLAGAREKDLQSDIAFKGLRKKALCVLLVGVGAFLEPQVGLPMAAILAGWFAGHEVLSLVENADRLGITLPPQVRDAIGRLQSTRGES